jgi:hypothetical protein
MEFIHECTEVKKGLIMAFHSGKYVLNVYEISIYCNSLFNIVEFIFTNDVISTLQTEIVQNAN